MYYLISQLTLSKEVVPLICLQKMKLKKVTREADDRLHNTLVIDENGFAKIVQGSEVNHSYSVRLSP